LVGEAPCHAAFNGFDVLLAAPAATLPGIVAKLACLQDIAKRDAFTDRPNAAILLLDGFAVSVPNVVVPDEIFRRGMAAVVLS
jgi:hypothetical protein